MDRHGPQPWQARPARQARQRPAGASARVAATPGPRRGGRGLGLAARGFTALAVAVVTVGSALATAAGGREDCWTQAARRHGVNPHLLVAIAEVESGLRADAVGRNRDGSVDLGLMQINSRWLPELRRHGLSATDLMHPCVSVHVGAWVLAQAMQRHGNTWTAVGAYHAGPGPYRDRYVRRVQQALARRMPPLAARVAALAGEPAAVDYSAMSALEAERVPGSGTLDASR